MSDLRSFRSFSPWIQLTTLISGLTKLRYPRFVADDFFFHFFLSFFFFFHSFIFRYARLVSLSHFVSRFFFSRSHLFTPPLRRSHARFSFSHVRTEIDDQRDNGAHWNGSS